jgi:hypothetical protein
MDLKINLKSKNVIIAASIITVVVMAGLYFFFNNYITCENPDYPNPVCISDQKNNNTPTSLISHDPALIESGVANLSNDPLNSKNADFPDMSQSQGENLRERDNGSEPDDSENMNDNMNLKQLFKDSVINKHTLNVTQMLQTKFPGSLDKNIDDLWSHYRQVEDFLSTQLNDEAKVDEFLNFYKKYTEYEIAQVRDPHSLWLETPENPEEAIQLNIEKHQYQRDVFGREVADTLWGDESKVAEYKMKELEILRTDTYSAQVKEQLIRDLREQTFGEVNGQKYPDYNYQLYLKLAIYGDELSRMTEDERNEKIKEFREEIFPPDKLQFLEFLEGVVETDSEETNDSEQDAF